MEFLINIKTSNWFYIQDIILKDQKPIMKDNLLESIKTFAIDKILVHLILFNIQ